MAGHSHFANIKYKKEAQDKKKSKIFTRLQRKIIIALKHGAPDPNTNSKLKIALLEARQNNLAKDKIEAVIKKASGNTDDSNYDDIRYNAYAPGGIAFIIEALTDNKNRTVGEIRAIFTKHGGSLAETGAVEFMFARIGMIKYPISIMDYDKMFEAVIESGANDLNSDEEFYYIETSFENFHDCSVRLSEKLGDSASMETCWHPHDLIEISTEQKEKIAKIVDLLEELDDVQDVYHNANLC